MIDYNFNRPDKAISGIRKLLTNHQNEIEVQMYLA